ncbi:MAG: PorV/PorQ family protein, partial [Ignavibacteriales bacterium]|nr:PorV/PorQ family protein [Ignavibacteriales bacterium]
SDPKGYQDVGTFKPTGLMLGVSYARALSDRFAIGANVKYVTQNLGDGVVDIDTSNNRITVKNKLDVLAFDFGVLYRTGFKSLEFGMSVRNFSKEVKYQQEQFQLPLIFKIGLSMNVLDLLSVDPKSQSLLVAVEATHPRDFREQVNVGGEYMFAQTLALRAGYMFSNDLYGFTTGVGVRLTLEGVELGIDYSYTPFQEFSNVHRMAIQMSL